MDIQGIISSVIEQAMKFYAYDTTQSVFVPALILGLILGGVFVALMVIMSMVVISFFVLFIGTVRWASDLFAPGPVGEEVEVFEEDEDEETGPLCL